MVSITLVGCPSCTVSTALVDSQCRRELYGSDPCLLPQHYHLPPLLTSSGSRSRLSAIKIWKHHSPSSWSNHQENIPFFITSAPVQNHPRPPYDLIVVEENQTGYLNARAQHPRGLPGPKGGILQEPRYLSPSSSPLRLCHRPVF